VAGAVYFEAAHRTGWAVGWAGLAGWAGWAGWAGLGLQKAGCSVPQHSVPFGRGPRAVGSVYRPPRGQATSPDSREPPRQLRKDVCAGPTISARRHWHPSDPRDPHLARHLDKALHPCGGQGLGAPRGCDPMTPERTPPSATWFKVPGGLQVNHEGCGRCSSARYAQQSSVASQARVGRRN
jgi:hypothetical protein